MLTILGSLERRPTPEVWKYRSDSVRKYQEIPSHYRNLTLLGRQFRDRRPGALNMQHMGMICQISTNFGQICCKHAANIVKSDQKRVNCTNRSLKI